MPADIKSGIQQARLEHAVALVPFLPSRNSLSCGTPPVDDSPLYTIVNLDHAFVLEGVGVARYAGEAHLPWLWPGLRLGANLPFMSTVHIHRAFVLVSVLRYLVATHLCLLRLGLRLSHGVLVLPLREVVEPRMLECLGC